MYNPLKQKNENFMEFTQNVFDAIIRVNAKYTFSLDQILPPVLAQIKYKLLPTLSYFIMVFSFCVIGVKIYGPLSHFTLILSSYSCYFILIAVIELCMLFHIYKNISLFFPSLVYSVKYRRSLALLMKQR
jgi:uncharacterized membrane protein